jgi:hypothetical protein
VIRIILFPAKAAKLQKLNESLHSLGNLTILVVGIPHEPSADCHQSAKAYRYSSLSIQKRTIRIV